MIRVRQHRADGVSRERLALEAKRSRGALAVYLIMAIVAVASIGVILRNIHAQYPWSDPLRIRVAVSDASAVMPGLNQVRLSGLQVGKIASSKLVDGHPVLTLSIEKQYGPIYRDARLSLRPQTALQDMYIDVESRGTPGAGKVSGDAALPAARTRTPVSISAVLDTFNTEARARMGTALDELGAGLNGRGEQLRQAFVAIAPFLNSAERFAGAIAERGTITRRLVHNLRVLTEEVGHRDRQLSSLVADGAQTMTAVSENATPLDRLMTELPPTLSQVSSTMQALRGGLDDLDPALRALGPTADALKPGLDALGAIASSADPALAALERPVARLQPFARSLRPTAASLRGAFDALAPTVPRLDRITRLVSRCELGIQKFFQWNPSVFKFGDNGGPYPRGDDALGTETAGGLVSTPGLIEHRTCSDPGGTRR
ncbi:MAG: Mammalian cell entry related protein [Solirubrobacterales bacterium]|nr:Mammalian cell entry related protein [Solirubrobacterales bacterium]